MAESTSGPAAAGCSNNSTHLAFVLDLIEGGTEPLGDRVDFEMWTGHTANKNALDHFA